MKNRVILWLFVWLIAVVLILLPSGISADWELQMGVPTDMAINAKTYYSSIYVNVGPAATKLTVTISNGTGDLDLYVKYGSPLSGASINELDADTDFVSDGPTASETIVVSASSSPPLQQGKWYISPANLNDYKTSFTLTATIEEAPTQQPPDTLAAPDLTITAQGLTATVSWSAVSGASGYYLFYCFTDSEGLPDYSTVGFVDMHGQTSISGALPNMTLLYIAARAYGNKGPGDLSEINILSVIDFGDAEVTFDDGLLLMGVNDPDGIGSVWFYGTSTSSGPNLTSYTTDTGNGYCYFFLDSQGRPDYVLLGSIKISFTYNADGTFNYEYTENGEIVASGDNLAMRIKNMVSPIISFKGESDPLKKTNNTAPAVRTNRDDDVKEVFAQLGHIEKLQTGAIYIIMQRRLNEKRIKWEEAETAASLDAAFNNPDLISFSRIAAMNGLAIERWRNKAEVRLETFRFINEIAVAAMEGICDDIIDDVLVSGCAIGQKKCGPICIPSDAECCDYSSGRCCVSGTKCCGAGCCDIDEVCCDDGSCADTQGECSGACPEGYTPCNGECMPDGAWCCADGNSFCVTGECCGSGCCGSSSQYCCGGSACCISPNDCCYEKTGIAACCVGGNCCDSGACCKPDEQCCGSGCCKPGSHCEGGTCVSNG